VEGSDEPTQLGRYEIVKRLTSGGMAELLLGRARGMSSFERHVVIKRIHTALARDPRFVQMFLEEARLAASLHHQNIVQVHDVGEQDGEYFFAMEYVHGEDLRKLHAQAARRKEQIPLEVVLAIVMAAAAGLHHAHEQRGPNLEPLDLVHRDVSLANILCGYDGSVKLLDFGLAKAAMRSVKTRTGSLKGKAEYMSPEQCMGRPLDRRSDLFALGIVLYELITARRLFKAANDFMSMSAIVGGDIPPPSTHRGGLPAGLDELVLRALARTREQRFSTAEEMRAALEQLAYDAGLRTSTKLLADYMHLAFGDKPEPWRSDLVGSAPSPDDDDAGGVVHAPDDPVPNSGRAATPIALAQAMAEGSDLDEFIEEPATTVDPPPDFAISPPSNATTGTHIPIIEEIPPEDVHTATTAVGAPLDVSEETPPPVPTVHVRKSRLQPIQPDATDDDTTTGQAPARGRAVATDEAKTAVAPKKEAIEDAPTGVSPSKPERELLEEMYVGPPAAAGWKGALDRHRGLVLVAAVVLAFAVIGYVLFASHSASDLAPADGPAVLDAPAAPAAPSDAAVVPMDAPGKKPHKH
jgi:serine/threonine-protein kinase